MIYVCVTCGGGDFLPVRSIPIAEDGGAVFSAMSAEGKAFVETLDRRYRCVNCGSQVEIQPNGEVIADAQQHVKAKRRTS